VEKIENGTDSVRNEKFLACHDEKSASHHQANGGNLIGYGKFKGAGLNGNGHANGTNGSNGNGITNGTTNGANGVKSPKINGESTNSKNGSAPNGVKH